MQIEWEENENGTDAKAIVDGIRLMISQYDENAHNPGRWYWGVTVVYCGRSGIVDTREQAIEQITQWVEKGREVICAAHAAEILAEIDERVQKLGRIDPDSAVKISGWGAGYKAGINAAQQALLALEIEE